MALEKIEVEGKRGVGFLATHEPFAVGTHYINPYPEHIEQANKLVEEIRRLIIKGGHKQYSISAAPSGGYLLTIPEVPRSIEENEIHRKAQELFKLGLWARLHETGNLHVLELHHPEGYTEEAQRYIQQRVNELKTEIQRLKASDFDPNKFELRVDKHGNKLIVSAWGPYEVNWTLRELKVFRQIAERLKQIAREFIQKYG